MAKFERRLFDLIEAVSTGARRQDEFAPALLEQIMQGLAEPLRIAAGATLQLHQGRYEPSFTLGAPLVPKLEGQLSARSVQRRLKGQLWWILRGIRGGSGDDARWFDLILIPIDRGLDPILALLTDSLAGEAGREREESFQAMGQLLRLFVDRHHQGERLNEIFTLAAEQQLSLLPPSLPSFPGYSAAAVSIPAEEVGGDYYQAFQPLYTAGAFAVADAKGKGFEAAMQVTGLHAGLRVVNETPFKLAHRVSLLNRSLIQTAELRNLISLFLAEWDHEGRMLYVNCSHPPPIWVRAGGYHTELSEGGRFLGLDAASLYRFGIAELKHGDLVVAYTDGWTELFNDKGEEFGSERFRELLHGQHGAEPSAVIDHIQRATDGFRGDAAFNDDRTLFVLRRD